MFASIQIQFHANVRSCKTEIEIEALGIQALVVGGQLDEITLFGAGILDCPPEQGAPNALAAMAAVHTHCFNLRQLPALEG